MPRNDDDYALDRVARTYPSDENFDEFVDPMWRNVVREGGVQVEVQAIPERASNFFFYWSQAEPEWSSLLSHPILSYLGVARGESIWTMINANYAQFRRTDNGSIFSSLRATAFGRVAESAPNNVVLFGSSVALPKTVLNPFPMIQFPGTSPDNMESNLIGMESFWSTVAHELIHIAEPIVYGADALGRSDALGDENQPGIWSFTIIPGDPEFNHFHDLDGNNVPTFIDALPLQCDINSNGSIDAIPVPIGDVANGCVRIGSMCRDSDDCEILEICTPDGCAESPDLFLARMQSDFPNLTRFYETEILDADGDGVPDWFDYEPYSYDDHALANLGGYLSARDFRASITADSDWGAPGANYGSRTQ